MLLLIPLCSACVPVQTSNNSLLLSYSAPIIDAVDTPAGRPVEGGFPIVVVGANFYPNVTLVTVNGQPCANVVVVPVTFSGFSCTAPPGSGRGEILATVAVTAPGTVAFAYDAPALVR